jgi:methylenetetrahydrofolate dehydrogenase (NADP+) / methenyltetrahydrofolate cyclohydrolase
MSATIIDGEAVAGKIRTLLTEEVNSLKKKGGHPQVKVVQVGDNAAYRLSVENQQKQCEIAGITYARDELPADTKEDTLISHIKKLNNNPKITGIILQIPLPEGIDIKKIQKFIIPHKDVEGIHPANMGELVYGNTRLVPCTAMAAVELVKSAGIEIKGKEVTIVGCSATAGKPISLLMLDLLAIPTVCHSDTRDLSAQTRKADILIVAAEKAGLIKGNMIKPGAVVIDVGFSLVKEVDAQGNFIMDKNGNPKMRSIGDVEFVSAKEVASHISPVPEGIAPVTVAFLLRNIVESLKMSMGL